MTTVPAPTTTVRAPRRGLLKRRDDSERMAVHNNEAAAQPVTDTVAEPLNKLAIRPSADAAEEPFRSAPLRCCCYLFRVTAFSFMFVSFCRYSFSLLCPRPPTFHHIPMPVTPINRIVVIFFCFEPYIIVYWLYLHCYIVFCCFIFSLSVP